MSREANIRRVVNGSIIPRSSKRFWKALSVHVSMADESQGFVEDNNAEGGDDDSDDDNGSDDDNNGSDDAHNDTMEKTTKDEHFKIEKGKKYKQNRSSLPC